jgi:acetylornithine/N-succinyldiaminopimelate aminotransferase
MKLIKGNGSYYHTSKRKLLDFTSGGIFQAILGNDPYIYTDIVGIKETVNVISCYAPHHTNRWTERYIDMLKEWTGFESVSLFTTGSEATEAFWRACRTYTGKMGVWGGLVDPDEVGTDNPRTDAMHGWTLGAMIMSGKITWPELGIGPEMGASRFGLAPEATGCMIMEPYHAPSAQFHKIKPTIERIIANQKEFPDIPLCIDEIQGGFGRTGKKWAHEWYSQVGDIYPNIYPKIEITELKPDFITIGKGMGAGMPISALLGPKEIMESKAVRDHGHLHSTHSGHPMMCAVGCAVIEYIEKHDLISHSYDMGFILDDELRSYLNNGLIRFHAGRGLLAGLEFADAKEARKVVKRCQAKGLLVVDTGRKWVKIGPALTITEDELLAGIQILRDAIEEVLNADSN